MIKNKINKNKDNPEYVIIFGHKIEIIHNPLTKKENILGIIYFVCIMLITFLVGYIVINVDNFKSIYLNIICFVGLIFGILFYNTVDPHGTRK